jgi:hypothetical protein
MSKNESVSPHRSNSVSIEELSGLQSVSVGPQVTQSLVHALADFSESERREILFSFSPHEAAQLIENLAAETSIQVAKMARLSPEIKRWAKRKGLL